MDTYEIDKIIELLKEHPSPYDIDRAIEALQEFRDLQILPPLGGIKVGAWTVMQPDHKGRVFLQHGRGDAFELTEKILYDLVEGREDGSGSFKKLEIDEAKNTKKA